MQNLALPILIVLATFGFMYFQRKKLATQFAHMRAAPLATRLGMRLTEGPPEFNLATQSVQPSVQNVSSGKGVLTSLAAAQVGGTLGEFKLHLEGEPYGERCELVLFCRQDLARGLARSTTTTWYDLRLSVAARATLVPFELRLRSEAAGLATQRDDGAPALPAQQFGDAALDARYVIETLDPALPARIAGVLGALPPFLMYARIVGAHDRVSFVMTPAAVMPSAPSFEPVLYVLVSIADVLAGRPAPAQQLVAV
jgi:hypothetical protein